MFAVFQTGGKQYKVTGDDIILVEKLAGEPGSSVDFPDVLMVGGEGAPSIGAPLVGKAKVTAQILEQTKGDKQIIFKKKRRQTYRRKKGHRQELTAIRIMAIELDGKQVAKAEKAAPKKAAKPVSAPAKQVSEAKASKPKAASAAKPKAEKKAEKAAPKKSADEKKSAPAKKAAAKKPAAKKTAANAKKKES